MSVQHAAIAGPNSYVELLDEAWQQHLAPRKADAPLVISLFAGCGGSSLGYSMAGYREVLAVERDPVACATFRLNFPAVSLYAGNIENLTTAACLSQSGLAPGQLDVLDGSPPCQGFSTAGKRQMADTRNQLFREYVRLLEVLQPRAFVMENVSGMVKGKMKLLFAAMLASFKQAGYCVRSWLMDAKYFHVPQQRQRMIFLGIRTDLDIMLLTVQAQAMPINAGKALACLPLLSSEDIQPASIQPSWQMFRVLSGTERKKHFGLVKLKLSMPAPTIMQDAGNTTTGLVHPTDMRKLTIPEIKRLASFPDDFLLEGSFKEQWSQIGNAVPPLFMRAIAQHVRTMLAASACHAVA